MSTYTYAVTDKGIVAKIKEINLEQFRSFIKEHNGQDLIPEEGDDILDALTQYLCDDCQYYLGKQWADGVICHKWSYGNDICGDFIPILKDDYHIDVDVEADDWVMMCLPRYASLFEKAYDNEDVLIAEMKTLYSKFLPENFDYKRRLVSLSAVAWG